MCKHREWFAGLRRTAAAVIAPWGMSSSLLNYSYISVTLHASQNDADGSSSEGVKAQFVEQGTLPFTSAIKQCASNVTRLPSKRTLLGLPTHRPDTTARIYDPFLACRTAPIAQYSPSGPVYKIGRAHV